MPIGPDTTASQAAHGPSTASPASGFQNAIEGRGDGQLAAVPTLAAAREALVEVQRLWQRTLPRWASDCLILQARQLRDPVWTPLSHPADWDDADLDLRFPAAA